MVELAGEINAEMPRFVVEKVQEGLNRQRKSVNGSRVLLLGVAYKRDIDDVRESPALDVIRRLEDKGAEVRFHDPYVAEIREEGIVREGVALTDAELAAADCVVITTDHTAIDYEHVVRTARLVVDTRNAIPGVRLENVVRLSGDGIEAGMRERTLALAGIAG
jgi:UDP-N-acetyl-D-glucosamine dehydrogenase